MRRYNRGHVYNIFIPTAYNAGILLCVCIFLSKYLYTGHDVHAYINIRDIMYMYAF